MERIDYNPDHNQMLREGKRGTVLVRRRPISEADKAPCGNGLAWDSPTNCSPLWAEILTIAVSTALAIGLVLWAWPS
jgi:hypothetical protein